MNDITFQRIDYYIDPHTGQQDKICKFVTDYYLNNHTATKRVYEELGASSPSRQGIFIDTFEKAMRISLSVLSKYQGHFYLAYHQESDRIVGFTMGMPYRPSIKPLTDEFFMETFEKCPEFFRIFEESMPLIKNYEKIKDIDLETSLNGKQIYYLGMIGSEDRSIASGLVNEVTKHVFSADSPFVALYTLSSGNHERDIVQHFEDKGFDTHRFGKTPEKPHLFIALIHPSQNPLAQQVIQLYAEIEKSPH